MERGIIPKISTQRQTLESAFKFSENMNNPICCSSLRCRRTWIVRICAQILSRLITLMPGREKIDAVYFSLQHFSRWQENTRRLERILNGTRITIYPRRRVRPYIISFQMAHLYQLEAFRDRLWGDTHQARRMGSSQSQASNPATIASNARGQPSKHAISDKVRSWLSIQDMARTRNSASLSRLPNLAAECVSESFQRKSERTASPKSVRKCKAAAESGDLQAATWATGALEREPYRNNFRRLCEHMLWPGTTRFSVQKVKEDDDSDADKDNRRTRLVSPSRKIKNHLDSHAVVLQKWTRHCLQTLRILAPLRRLARWTNPTEEEIAAVLRCQVAYRRKHGNLARHMKMQARF